MWRDNYFAGPDDIKKCRFIRSNNKMIMKFNGVEVYPLDNGLKSTEVNNYETTAVLELESFLDDYDEIYRYHLTISEDINLENPIKFEPAESLLVECGAEVM